MLHTETLLGFHDSSRFETTGEAQRKKGSALHFLRTATARGWAAHHWSTGRVLDELMFVGGVR